MRSAELYTLGGVVFSNNDPFSFDAVSTYSHQDPLLYIAPPIPSLDRTPETTWYMSPKQLAEYATQSFNSVKADSLYYLWGREGVDVYGNTGRPNKHSWRKLTEHTIEQGHLGARFVDIFYCPRDVSGIVSKGEAIIRMLEKYDNVTHYDNNPWVIFGLARVLPRAQFVLVQGLSSGVLYTQDQVGQFGNVKVEGRLEYIEADTVAREAKKKRKKRYASVFEEHERSLQKNREKMRDHSVI